MVILYDLLHSFCDGADLQLLVKIVKPRIIDDIVYSELYFLIFFLIVGENESLYELGVNFV